VCSSDLNPARFESINARMADDLVAAPRKVNRIKLQGAEPLHQGEHRSTACWKLSRREEHVALGEEAASRRP
jgi:hypothetical protein